MSPRRFFLLLLASWASFARPCRAAEPDKDVEAAISRQSKVASFHREAETDPKLIELGKKLFFDARLSRSGKMNCATCHIPSRAFGDGLARSIGKTGKPVARNAPNLINSSFHSALFWDGRAATIDEASLIAIQNPEEMDTSLPNLKKKLESMPEYVSAFAEVFPRTAISSTTIGRAWGAYVRSLSAPEDSPFDHFLADRKGLSPAQVRGFLVFAHKAECIYCHSSAHFNYNDRYQNIGLKSSVKDDLGRYRVEKSPDMMGAFRVPSLRNVALTAPYMHDGQFATLQEVIEYYDKGGNKTRYQDTAIRPLHLTQAEKDDLLAFLMALTSTSLAPGASATR